VWDVAFPPQVPDHVEGVKGAVYPFLRQGPSHKVPYQNTFQEWFGPTAIDLEGMGAVWERQAQTLLKGLLSIGYIRI
jgi:hypothetical protein